MDNAIYAGLTRQSGLMREMQVIANNLANISTTGFKREGVIFSEYVAQLRDAPSLSMARASARDMDLGQGSVERTGGPLDLAILGEGFFLIGTPEGERLSRAGHFTQGPEGEMLNPDGYPLLDEGGAPIALPAGAAQVSIASDGTMSAAGVPFARVGLWAPADPLSLRHLAGTLFTGDAVEPMETPASIMQGHLEASNVEPVAEVSRMIEVQRAYELGQSLLDREDQRIRAVIETLGR